MMKRFLLLTVGILFIQSLFAQAPADYYDAANGKTGSELKTALFNIIKDHTVLSYTPGLWEAYYKTDVDKYYENDGSVLDIYSENPSGTDPYNFVLGDDQDDGSNVAEGVHYNREHSFPKSFFNSESPMVTDIFHIYPTDKVVNGERSNWPYGEVDNPTWTSANGSKLGPCSYAGYTGTAFEPIDEFKGDLARTYFYMATCYEDKIASWETNSTESNIILNGTSFPCYETWFLNMLLEWNNNDPLSQKEIDRNDSIYKIQHNRNPYIDHPEYVAQVWGGSGNMLPSITYITKSNDNPTPADAVSISAVLKDYDGTISSAQLYWGLSSGSLSNTINMSISVGDTYVTDTDIPAQADGTIVYFKIEATDNESGTHTSIIKNYYVGNNVPQISNIINTPISPTSGNTVNISASITDVDGTISSAELHWGLSSGSLSNTINMSVSSGDTYVTDTDIPAQANGVTVYYEISATDNDAANKTTSVLSYIVSDGGSTGELLNEDFSSCTGTGWITYSVAGSANWTCGSGYESVNAYNADAASNDWLISPAQDLDSYDNEVLSFKSWTKYTDTYNPPIYLKYSTNYSGSGDPTSATWHDLNPTWSVQNSQVWTESGNIDISGIAGTDVYFAFQYISSGTGSNTCTQWEIDDVMIKEEPVSPVNQVPVITNIIKSPASPTENDDITVSATITDSDGTISLAKIKWGTSSGSYPNTVTMTNSESTTYTGIIPKHTSGTIYFIIQAIDNDSGISNSFENSYNVSLSNGLIDVTENNYKVYPNPTRDKINIELKNSAQIKSINIYNIIGEKMYQTSNLNTSNYTIDLSKFPKGIYILKIGGLDQDSVHKIMLK